MQVVDALIKADKDFELLVFPGAGHGAGGEPLRRAPAARLLRPAPARRRAARIGTPPAPGVRDGPSNDPAARDDRPRVTVKPPPGLETSPRGRYGSRPSARGQPKRTGMRLIEADGTTA